MTLPKINVIDLIDAPLLHIAAREASIAALADWVEPIKAACRVYDIDTVRRVAAFLAQMAHESGLKPRSENLNYSVNGLLKVFGRHRISVSEAMRYGRTEGRAANQEMIANIIYGGEYGQHNLGNSQPGDGWLCRGSGPLQVTGRRNFTRFAAATGMEFEEALGFARTLSGGIMAAAWFWEENDINRLADTPGVEDESRRINGGVNGLADRRARFDRLVAYLLKRGA